MMGHRDSGTFSSTSDIFPYMPFPSSKVLTHPYRSRERTNNSSFQSGSHSERSTSPARQHKPSQNSVEKLALPKLENSTPRRRYAGGSMIRQMDGLSTQTHEDIEINPEPAPYKSEDFMSSTVMKNVPISKRHLDTFSNLDNLYSGRRGQALHTQRYSKWETSRSLESMTQRERLIAEIEGIERLRDIRRKTEILPHRLAVDMCMGGKRVDIEERFDINKEIRRLKAMVLPTYAKDLYHGRGISLPSNHGSIKPRKLPIPDTDLDDQVTNSAPATIKRGQPYPINTDRFKPQRSFMESIPNRKETLPPINYQPSFGFDASLSRTNTNVLPSLEKNPASWVKDQNQHLQERQNEVEQAQVNVTLPNVERSNTDLDKSTPVAPPPTAGATTITPGYTPTPLKSNTPYPLKGTELTSEIPEESRIFLTETFKKLDTDSDGHLKFNQVLPELPKEFTPQQQKFIKQVYDISNSNTYFGIDEFLTMSQLGQNISDLGNEAKLAFNQLNEDIDLNELILHYVDLFQAVDRTQSGKISLNSLKEVLTTALHTDLQEDNLLWDKLLTNVNMTSADQISKIEFLAHLPYFYQHKPKS